MIGRGWWSATTCGWVDEPFRVMTRMALSIDKVKAGTPPAGSSPGFLLFFYRPACMFVMSCSDGGLR